MGTFRYSHSAALLRKRFFLHLGCMSLSLKELLRFTSECAGHLLSNGQECYYVTISHVDSGLAYADLQSALSLFSCLFTVGTCREIVRLLGMLVTS